MSVSEGSRRTGLLILAALVAWHLLSRRRAIASTSSGDVDTSDPFAPGGRYWSPSPIVPVPAAPAAPVEKKQALLVVKKPDPAARTRGAGSGTGLQLDG